MTKKRKDVEIIGYTPDSFNREARIIHHQLSEPNRKARFAMAMIERWGMVAAENDGEDSAGRAKLRAATVKEVVDRACSAAHDAFEEFERRGWMIENPTYAEVEEMAEERRKRDREKN